MEISNNLRSALDTWWEYACEVGQPQSCFKAEELRKLAENENVPLENLFSTEKRMFKFFKNDSEEFKVLKSSKDFQTFLKSIEWTEMKQQIPKNKIVIFLDKEDETRQIKCYYSADEGFQSEEDYHDEESCGFSLNWCGDYCITNYPGDFIRLIARYKSLTPEQAVQHIITELKAACV